MTYPTAIVIAAALIAGAILVDVVDAQASEGRPGRYSFSTSSDLIRVRVLDTETGALTRCTIEGPSFDCTSYERVPGL